MAAAAFFTLFYKESENKMMKKRKKSGLMNIYSYKFAMPAIIIYTLMFLIPTILGVFTAFTEWNMRDLYKFTFNGLENFIRIFEDPNFLLAISNTFLFAIVSTVIKVVIAVLLALALTQKLKTASLLRGIFYMPSILSGVVVGLIFTSFFKMDGMFDQILRLFGYGGDFIWLGDERTAMLCVIAIDIWKGAGFSMMIFIAGLQSISSDYYEAAALDGAKGVKKFFYVTMPLLMPSFTIVITSSLISGLKVFDSVFVLTGGGPGFATQVLATYVYKNFSAGFLGKSSAMSLVLTIIVCICTMGLNKYMRSKEVEA